MDSKSPEAFRTISEVATELDLPQHVLRFWETRFSQIRPLKRGGGRRYYRPDDVELLRGIRQLLYGDGYTIKGVQKILREQGVRHVIQLVDDGNAEDDEAADRSAGSVEDAGAIATQQHHHAPVWQEATPATPAGPLDEPVTQRAEPTRSMVGPPPKARVPAPHTHNEDAAQSGSLDQRIPVPPAKPAGVPGPPPADNAAQRLNAPAAGPSAREARPAYAWHTDHGAPIGPPTQPPQEAPAEFATVPPPARTKPAEKSTLPRDIEPDKPAESGDGRQPFRLIDRLRGDKAGDEQSGPLSRDEVRRLQATLFELLECKRLLDQAR